MKFRTIFSFFLIAINFANLKCSQTATAENSQKPVIETSKDLIGDFLKKSLSWTIFASSSPFKKPILKVIAENNSTEHVFPTCTEDQAKQISSSLSESFRGMPAGYPDCLRTILTGENDTELLMLTTEAITIQDKEQKSLRFREDRKKTPQ